MVLKIPLVGKLPICLPLEETQGEVTLDQIALNVYDWLSRRKR
jgi:hypothetical protein